MEIHSVILIENDVWINYVCSYVWKSIYPASTCMQIIFLTTEHSIVLMTITHGFSRNKTTIIFECIFCVLKSYLHKRLNPTKLKIISWSFFNKSTSETLQLYLWILSVEIKEILDTIAKSCNCFFEVFKLVRLENLKTIKLWKNVSILRILNYVGFKLYSKKCFYELSNFKKIGS